MTGKQAEFHAVQRDIQKAVSLSPDGSLAAKAVFGLQPKVHHFYRNMSPVHQSLPVIAHAEQILASPRQLAANEMTLFPSLRACMCRCISLTPVRAMQIGPNGPVGADVRISPLSKRILGPLAEGQFAYTCVSEGLLACRCTASCLRALGLHYTATREVSHLQAH